MKNETEDDHGKSQAAAQYESVSEMVQRLEHSQNCTYSFEEYTDDKTLCDSDIEFASEEEFDSYHDEDSARQAIDEDPNAVVQVTQTALLEAARLCARNGSESAASAARSAAWSAAWSAAESAWSAASAAESGVKSKWSPDAILALSAEIATEACIKFKTQGSKWLDIVSAG